MITLRDLQWRRRRFVIAVLPIDELNAFACGGHLVVVTSYAIYTLPRDELSGVLAHESPPSDVDLVRGGT